MFWNCLHYYTGMPGKRRHCFYVNTFELFCKYFIPRVILNMIDSEYITMATDLVILTMG